MSKESPTIEELQEQLEKKRKEQKEAEHKALLLEYAKTIKPKDGKDANEERIIVKTALQVLKRIPKPKDGEPGKDAPPVDEDKLLQRVLSKIPEPEKLDTKDLERKILAKVPKLDLEPIKTKIDELNNKTLKKVKDIESATKDIKRTLSFQSSNQSTSYGGEVDKLSLLTSDVKINNPTNGQLLIWNSTDGKWENGSSSSVNDHKVLNTSADTTPNYLNSKVSVSGGIVKSITSPGGNEVLNLDGSAFYLAANPAGYYNAATLPAYPSVGSWGALNYPTWASGTPFVKMTAAGTFALDTNTYLTSLSGAWLLNGNTLGAKTTLGSIDNYDIGFLTDNTERMTILANGNVGIGTTTPYAKLTVGTGANAVDISPNAAAQGERNAGGMINVEGIGWMYLYPSRVDGSSASGVGLAYYSASLGIKSALEIANTASNSGNLLLMKSGGNVGIGTTSPGSKLSVVGLPTSVSGLSSGDIYQVAGVLMIVP